MGAAARFEVHEIVMAKPVIARVLGDMVARSL
jgi:hypothetical protein